MPATLISLAYYIIFFFLCFFSLLDIVSSASQDSYVKLITSSLFYGREGNCRAVLSKALCAGQEVSRKDID